MNVSVQKFRNTQMVIALIAFLFGFLIISQIRSQAPLQDLMEMTEQDLSVIIQDQSLEVSALREESYELKLRLSEYERTEAGKRDLLNKAAQDLQALKVLAGVVSVEGKGIRFKINDQGGMLQPYDILEAVNELKSAGAEAVAINGIRLNAQTPIYNMNGDLYLGDKQISAPYRLEAIGDPENLYQALVLPGGIKDTMTSLPDVYVRIEKAVLLKLPSAGGQKETEQVEK